MRRFSVHAIWLLAMLASACQQQPSVSSTEQAQPMVQSDEPTQAQPRLQTIKLWVGAEELTTELALTAVQQRTGMMFRTNMLENEAMLFVASVPHRASFWMKNTVLPLSAAYIDPDGAILEIRALEPRNTNSVVANSEQVQYVLETKQGWFERHRIQPGMVVRTERGTLRETFFRQ